MEIVLICGGLLVVVVIIALVSLKTKDSSTTGYARNSRSVKPAPRVVRPVYAKKTRTSSGLVPQSATAPLHGENEDKVSVRVSVSVADDPPPSQRPFLTEEVRLLAEEYAAEYHKDYRFLDPNYSPGSHMPFADLTQYVAEWYGSGKQAALYELWSYIGDFRNELAMREALRIGVPEGLSISDYARNEMWAVYALTLRMELAIGRAEFPGAVMMASIFSTRDVALTEDLRKALSRLVRAEFAKRNKEFGDGKTAAELNAEVKDVFAALDQGVAGCAGFAAIMKTVPPTVREAIAGAMRQPGGDDRLWNRRIHYSLGYGERAYGCSEKLNRECANSLDILDSVDPSEFGVPNSVTKAMIMEGLAARGVAFKKSAKRDDLLRLAWTCEGLVRELVDQAEPDLRVIKPEYAHEACVWADRNRRLIPFAQAVMAYMGLVRIGQTERRTTLDKVLENQAAMVCGEYNYGH